MSLPVYTTTVSSVRPPAKVDGQDVVTNVVVLTAVRGRVSSISASESQGSMESADAVLFIDADVDVRRQDVVTDDVTSEVWDVTWVRVIQGLGLDHLKAGLMRSKGSA